MSWYRVRGKRLLDVSLAAIGLVLLGPVIVLAAGLVAATLGLPLLFTQERAGRAGRPFRLFKLRTMRPPESPSDPDAARLTRLGRLLRSLSIDELPQLWNVLRGDMSLVGPRPLLPAYVPLYDDQQRRRLEVLPGITGWAQIHGRNALDWATRFRYDVWYVDRVSLRLDLGIMVRTVGSILSRRGISQAGQATTGPFQGTPKGSRSIGTL